MVFVKQTGHSDNWFTKMFRLPDAHKYDLRIIEPKPKITIQAGGKAVALPHGRRRGRSYYIYFLDNHRGEVTVSYDQTKVTLVGGHPVIEIASYTRPYKRDPQSVRELDAHTWTQAKEAATK